MRREQNQMVQSAILTHDTNLNVTSRRWRPLWWWVPAGVLPLIHRPHRHFIQGLIHRGGGGGHVEPGKPDFSSGFQFKLPPTGANQTPGARGSHPPPGRCRQSRGNRAGSPRRVHRSRCPRDELCCSGEWEESRRCNGSNYPGSCVLSPEEGWISFLSLCFLFYIHLSKSELVLTLHFISLVMIHLCI